MSARPGHVVALCGGVGGAKLARGLVQALPPEELTLIVNTGDDFRHLGLHISPDLDSVMYALAGLSDPVRGWGRREETWAFMDALREMGAESWFQLGDRDLAVHVERSWRMASGATLTEVTAHLCQSLGVPVRVLPMSDDPVQTRLLTAEGWLDFQHYFVRRRCQPAVQQIMFAGAATARPQPAALAALLDPALRAVIICPSNPFVSIEPILALEPLREALVHCCAPVVAVTPIIAGQAVKGPAAKMMQELGLEVSAASVATRYEPLIDGFVLEASDAPPAAQTLRYFSAATLMRSPEDEARLARTVLEAAASLAPSPSNPDTGAHHG
jgi:LPPG:FO 2-phospho-L-lactate transferase